MERRDSLEVVAKTVEEATEIALRELGAARDEVEVEVISRGRPGFLGFGADPARVRVSRTSSGSAAMYEIPEVEEDDDATIPASELLSVGRTITGELLRLMGVTAQAYLREEVDADMPGLDIEGEDSGLLIGRRGETLQSLEYLVNYLLSRRLQQRARIQLDVEGYKERRFRSLRHLAQRTAEKVASSGRSVTLNPMTPAERRIVHIALSNHPRVATQSVGEGNDRKVTIIPKSR